MSKQWFSVGIGIGVVLGLATDNLAVWIGVGVAIGAALDNRSQNRGCEKRGQLQ